MTEDPTDVAVIASSAALTAEFERLARYGTLPPSAYTTALGLLRELQVTASDADLFADLSRASFEDEYDIEELSIHSWGLAKAVGTEGFVVLADAFEMSSEEVVRGVSYLLDAGMTVTDIASHRYLADDTGRGSLSPDDVLSLHVNGVPGGYYAGLCAGLPRIQRPTVSETLTFFHGGVTEGYANHLLTIGVSAADVLSFWQDGLPIEYAVVLVSDGEDE